MKTIIILVLIPLILVAIWFREGYLLGSGESGLPFYDTSRELNLVKWAWGEGGLGINIGIITAVTPTYWILAQLQNLNISGFLLQAILFYLFFAVSGVFIYYLTREFFPNLGNKYYLLAVLFYWFNPISLVSVWNRFLYNYMFFWAELPLILYLTILGIKKRSLWTGLIISLVLTLFSYSESAVPFDLLIGFLIIFTILFYALIERRFKDLFLFKFIFILAITFLLNNFWWITQFFSFLYSSNFSTTTSMFFTPQGNLQGLTAISAALGHLVYMMRMMHSSFLGSGPIWARVYSLNIVAIIEFLVPLLLFWTFYKFRKTKEVLFLISLFLLTLFLMKGNQPPFGEIFEYFFIHVPVLQVFRNPFEKFSLLLPLVAAPLFVFGLKQLVKSIVSRGLKRTVLGFYVGLVIVFWGFPFWTGLVFTSADSKDTDRLFSYSTKVPDYYKQANNWLNSQGSNFRFVSFPLGGQGMTYTWDKPYSGVELSSALFDAANISFNTSVPYYDKIAGNLERFMMTKDNFSTLLSLLNVKYLIVRSDIDWKSRDVRNPSVINDVISNDKEFQKAAEFGNLKIYSIPKDSYQERIYISKSNTKVEPIMDLEGFITATGKEEAVYSNDTILPGTNWFVINPVKTTYIEKNKKYEVSNSLDRLLYSKHLPGDLFYPIIRIRERFDRIIQAHDAFNRFIFDLTHTGKRIAEVYQLVDRKKDQNQILLAANVYLESLDAILEEFPDKFSDSPTNGLKSLEQEEFNKHFVILLKAQEVLKQNGINTLDPAVEKLNNFMIDYGFTTIHPILDGYGDQKFVVYRFKIDKDDFYDLLLGSNQLTEFNELDESDFKVQLDDRILALGETSFKNQIGLKKVFLNKGVHEVIIGIPKGKNLIGEVQEIVLDSSVNPSVKFDISPFDPYATYEIAYDYWIKKGNQFDFVSFSDNDSIDSKGRMKNYKETMGTNGYNNDFLHQTTFLTPKNGASRGGVGFYVKHFKVCNESINPLFQTCDYSKPTEIVIKNFQVKKVFKNPVRFLLRSDSGSLKTPDMFFKKISPSEYKINITNATDPYILVLSELYHSGWELQIGDGQVRSDLNHFLVNGYANGWLVDRRGDYEMTVKFLPQDALSVGMKISLLAVTLSSILLIGRFVLKRI